MLNNDTYREACARSADDLPLFHQPWWLDAVAGTDGWQGLVSQKRYRDRPSLLPIQVSSTWGVRKIRKPTLTPYQGIYWPGWQRLTTTEQLDAVQQTWPELLNVLPQVGTFRQPFYPEVRLVQPFLHAGYRANLRYTYIIQLSPEHDDLFTNYRRDTQRAVKRYVDRYNLEESMAIDILYRLIEPVYTRQSLPVPFSPVFLTRVYEMGRQRKQTRLFFLTDQNQQINAGALLFFDTQSTYLLASGLTPQGRHAGAMPVLIHKILHTLSRQRTTFDFCGSKHPGIAAFNRSFGALPVGYLDVERTQGLAKLRGLW